jgi:signal peptidase I
MAVREIPFSGFSMYPVLRPGDTLIVREVSLSDISVGDIVCITRNGSYRTHRVIALRDGIIETKGDNMVEPDPHNVPSDDLLMRVVMIKRDKKRLVRPRFGRLVACLSRINLTPGIIMGRVGRVFRFFLTNPVCGKSK